jgi:hypothetical protein
MKQHGFRYCPTCNNKLQKRGLTAAGSQRWYCPGCRISSTKSRDDLSRKKQLHSFVLWLLGRKTLQDVCNNYYGNGRTISVRQWQRNTAWCWYIGIEPVLTGQVHQFILLDGIRIGNSVCIIARSSEYVLNWHWVEYESSLVWSRLLSTLPPPSYVITDGQKGMQLAIRSIWPLTIIQRCLFHVWLNLKAKLTLNPRSEAGIDLLYLFKGVWDIRSLDQASEWIEQFQSLNLEYASFLGERTIAHNPQPGQRKWWYTHSGVRSGYRQILKLIKDEQLFRYLEQEDIPRTTNYLEGGINAPIRQLLRLHKGLDFNRQRVLVDNYLYSRTEN